MNIPTPEDKDKEMPHSKSLPTQGSEKHPAHLIRRRKSTGERHNHSAGVYLFNTRKIREPISQKSAVEIVELTEKQLAAIPDKEAVPDDHSYPTKTRFTP